VLAPELPSPGPDWAELYAEGAFSQRALIDGRALRKEAAKRGISLPLFPRKEALEPLDAVGALCPIGFRQTNYTAETTWIRPDPDMVVWREQRNFQQWDAYAWRHEHDLLPNVSELYSPWQLLYVADAVDGQQLIVSVDQVLRLDDVHQRRELERAAEYRRHRRTVLDDQWRPVLKLLVVLQPRVWPFRVGRTTLVYDPDAPAPEGRVDPLELAVENFDPHATLRRFNLTLDSLAELHLAFAQAARAVDPAPHWYRLEEAAPRPRTDLLRGDALRARDLYDACFLLRGLYFLATGRRLPEPDEIDNVHTVEQWRRRHLPRRDQPEPRTRLGIKSLLIAEGLYPHRIHFFVEGDTEEIVLRQLLPFLGSDPTSGITITNIRGIDKAERYSVLFGAASQYAARTVIVADREGEIERTLTRLRHAGLFADENDVLLWEVNGRPASFEEANFTVDELLGAIAKVGRDRDPQGKLTLSADEVTAEFERQIESATRESRPRPALANVALRLARQERHGAIHATKGSLAPYLAHTLIDAVRDAGHLADAAEGRPLLARLWRWLQTTR
jgi:hypothetical protein